MAEKISWTLSAEVDKGPRISVSDALWVDAYDKIGVTVGAGEDETVEVQPGGAGRVQFLLITTKQFSDDLTYKVNDGEDEEEAHPVKLDGPQMLVGDGAVGLLGEAPKTFTFTNDLDQVVDVQILVGRQAVAPTANGTAASAVATE
jgi:hypothetical protein